MKASQIVGVLVLGVSVFGCGGNGSSTLDRSTTGDPFGSRQDPNRNQTTLPLPLFLAATSLEAPTWVHVDSIRAVGAKETVPVMRAEEAGWLDLKSLSDEKGFRPRWVGLTPLALSEIVRVEVVVSPKAWLGVAPEDKDRSTLVRLAEADEPITLRLERRRKEADKTSDALLIEIRAKLTAEKRLTLSLAEGDARLAKDLKRQAEGRVAAKVRTIEPDGQRQLWELTREALPNVLAALPNPKEAPAKIGEDVWVHGVYDLKLKRLEARQITKREVTPSPQPVASPDRSPAKPAAAGSATPAKP